MATTSYIDLVLAKPNGFPATLFYAPPFSKLGYGDTCIVEVESRIRAERELVLKSADVISCITLDRNSELKTLDFILKSCGMTSSDVNKVVSRVIYKEFDFEDVGGLGDA